MIEKSEIRSMRFEVVFGILNIKICDLFQISNFDIRV